ncbi:MAG: glycosyltransferase family 4 protein [Chloroflexi bacterium]|nr:glycosyltransferase family 4 protein [Chloroflexota bacterium]
MSVAPLFKDAVHGGSQRALTLVAQALARVGHRVRIVCSERAENRGGFELRDGVTVEPVLRLRGFFPDPYEVPPHQIADTARNLKPLVEWADRIYLHADIFHFRSLVPPAVPIIRSFHDFHYETALVSAFGYGADLTIVPSDYLRRCIQATVGESGLRALEPVEVIPNGIDLDVYRSDGPREPSGAAPGRPGEIVLLHPHRPDPRKGIEQALHVVQALRKRQPRRPVRLLVPRHVDAPSDAGVAAYYADVERRAREMEVADSIEFHPWFGEQGMPPLYRFSDVTLCLGSFIESFGLTVYESLACGTPVVAARVGALREAPDFADLHRVEYGDIAAATDAVIEAGRGMRDPEGARKLLERRYSLGAMGSAYVDAIEGANASGTGGGVSSTAGAAPYRLAPWCHVAGTRIYNDYAYRHLEMPELGRALSSRREPGWALSTLVEQGVSHAELEEALTTGVLIRSESALV